MGPVPASFWLKNLAARMAAVRSGQVEVFQRRVPVLFAHKAWARPGLAGNVFEREG